MRRRHSSLPISSEVVSEEAVTERLSIKVMSKNIRRHNDSTPAKVEKIVGLALLVVAAIVIVPPLVGFVFGAVMALVFTVLKVALGVGACYLLYRLLTRKTY